MEPMPKEKPSDNDVDPDTGTETETFADKCPANSHFPSAHKFATRFPNTAPEAFGLLQGISKPTRRGFYPAYCQPIESQGWF